MLPSEYVKLFEYNSNSFPFDLRYRKVKAKSFEYNSGRKRVEQVLGRD